MITWEPVVFLSLCSPSPARAGATRSSPEFFRADIYNRECARVVLWLPPRERGLIVHFSHVTLERVSFVPWAGQRAGRVEVGYHDIMWCLPGCFFLKGISRLDFVSSGLRCPRRVRGPLRAFAGLHPSGWIQMLRSSLRSQHKDKLAVSNCCTVMYADPPFAERHLHRWIPVGARRLQQRCSCPSLSIILDMTQWFQMWNISVVSELKYECFFFLRGLFCSRLIYLQMRSSALTSTYIWGWSSTSPRV